jgi:hypothetical protein
MVRKVPVNMLVEHNCSGIEALRRIVRELRRSSRRKPLRDHDSLAIGNVRIHRPRNPTRRVQRPVPLSTLLTAG